MVIILLYNSIHLIHYSGNHGIVLLVPSAPKDVKVVPAGQHSVIVSWRPPARANGRIIKYTVTFGYNNRSYSSSSNTTVTTTEQHVLINDLKYKHIQVPEKNNALCCCY